jgi:hypothetical protein
MNRRFSPFNGMLVWYNLGGFWTYAKVLSYNVSKSEYEINVQGDCVPTRTISAVDAQLYSEGKYHRDQRVTFTHQGKTCQGLIIRPTSPKHDQYFVKLVDDPRPGFAIATKDLH